MKQILISMIAALALCLSAQAQEGPAVPKLMSMPEFYDQFDATGQYIDNLIWGLRTTSESDATALPEVPIGRPPTPGIRDRKSVV